MRHQANTCGRGEAFYFFFNNIMLHQYVLLSCMGAPRVINELNRQVLNAHDYI